MKQFWIDVWRFIWKSLERVRDGQMLVIEGPFLTDYHRYGWSWTVDFNYTLSEDILDQIRPSWAYQDEF